MSHRRVRGLVGGTVVVAVGSLFGGSRLEGDGRHLRGNYKPRLPIQHLDGNVHTLLQNVRLGEENLVQFLPAGGVGVARLLAKLLQLVQALGSGVSAVQVADLCVAVSLARLGDACENGSSLCCVEVGDDGRHEDFVGHSVD